jgi:hypothetical protein
VRIPPGFMAVRPLRGPGQPFGAPRRGSPTRRFRPTRPASKPNSPAPIAPGAADPGAVLSPFRGVHCGLRLTAEDHASACHGQPLSGNVSISSAQAGRLALTSKSKHEKAEARAIAAERVPYRANAGCVVLAQSGLDSPAAQDKVR